MTTKIFIVEDSPADQRFLALVLGRDYKLFFSDGTDRPVDRMESSPPDLILLDLQLPDTDGLRLMRELRTRPALRNVPVFFASASREVKNRIHGLQLGAHDFLLKPLHAPELRLRVRNFLRLLPRTPRSEGPRLRAGALSLDVEKFAAYVEQGTSLTRLNLGAMEFKLLAYFLRHSGEVLSRREILGGVWGDDVHVSERTIDVHVSRLRREVEYTGVRIEALYGRGYRFYLDAA